jgi:NADH-quinone oxidoreductase subunit F
MHAILTDITEGQGRMEDLDTLTELSDVVKNASLCLLGGTAPNPVLTTLRYFRDEYIAHIRDKKCPAHVCKKLITYRIDAQKCKGCGACLKPCPALAVAGEKNVAHAIDAAKCIRCGACHDACKFNAVELL